MSNSGHLPIINEDPQTYTINQIYTKTYGFPLNVKDNGSDNLMKESDKNNVVMIIKIQKFMKMMIQMLSLQERLHLSTYKQSCIGMDFYVASLSKH